MSRRILISVTNDITYDRRMQRIAGSLSKAGYTVCMIGRSRKNSSPLQLTAYKTVRLNCVFDKGLLFYAEFNIRLLLYLLLHSADIYYAVDLDTILPNVFASKLRSSKCIYDAHEYFTETPEVERRPLVQKAWQLIARFAIPETDLRITVGEALASELADTYNCNFEVVRNVPPKPPLSQPPNPSAFRPQPIVLYQGALNEGRGLELAIRAMKQLPGVKLWLMGEGDLSEHLRNLTDKLGLNDQVVFFGFVKPEDLSTYTSQAWVGLNLLENRSRSYYLSLANKTFDYIQASLPAIHMDFPEYQNLMSVHKVGLLLPKLTEDALTPLLRKLLFDQSMRNLIQEECHEAAEVYNWELEEGEFLQTLITL